MRGAHRGVWCSKSTPLIEAELFAAERCRPALSGRALLCAADNAREIQGSSATYKLKNARNRAPVSLVSPRDRRESRCKGGFGGVKRGQGNHTVPLPPFAPAGGHRRLRRRAAAMPGLPIGSQSRLQRRTAVSAEINPLLRVKKKERRMACRPQTVKRKTHRLSPVRSGVTQTPFESGSYRPPCRRRWRAGCCASRRAALRSARCTAARERRVCRSPSRHS